MEDNARLLRIEPGQKTLAGASPFSLTDLQTGDRVMARGSANADGKSLAATMLVAIKGADIAQKQEREREDWQKRGTGGLVKSVDPAAGTVTISSGAGGTRTMVIHATPTTIVRRYAPGSVKFDQAVKSTLDQIKPGDQLRARGSKKCRRDDARRGGDCQRKLPESRRPHPGGERGCVDDHADRYRYQEACGHFRYA